MKKQKSSQKVHILLEYDFTGQCRVHSVYDDFMTAYDALIAILRKNRERKGSLHIIKKTVKKDLRGIIK